MGSVRSQSLPGQKTFRRTPEQDSIGVYIHWPFCLSKCPYCDFNSHIALEPIDHDGFRQALLAELSHMAALAPKRQVGSIFFGGGTPSLMPVQTVAALLDHIAALWTLQADVEITLEANPTSVEAGKFKALRQAGVNRVSLGVQALSSSALRALGRTHSVEEAEAAIAIAQAHFDRMSFDLIYARPKQSLTAWRQELKQGLDLAAGHLSLYQLTIEPGTPFARWHAAGRLVLPDEDQAAAFYELTQELCEAVGMPAYEISNHAIRGEEARHNLNYWRYGEYVGVGPGAHGRLNLNGARVALATYRDPAAWLEQVRQYGHGLVSRNPITPSQQIEERLLMGLRLIEGIDLAPLAQLGWRPADDVLQMLTSAELLQYDSENSRLRATRRGRLVLNSVIAELVR